MLEDISITCELEEDMIAFNTIPRIFKLLKMIATLQKEVPFEFVSSCMIILFNLSLTASIVRDLAISCDLSTMTYFL